jgi:RNA polymerase sigma factor (sigma-70 family)
MRDHSRDGSGGLFIQFDLPEDTKLQLSPSDNLEFQDLIGLLDRLPERSAQVFRLFAIEGYSHDEISTMMNISTGTSKWHLSHARERLRTILASENHARSSSL